MGQNIFPKEPHIQEKTNRKVTTTTLYGMQKFL